MNMKKLPIGLQNFKNIITDNYLYIDKTPQIYKLLTEGQLYFLSRPRRFGKSLLISTLIHIFRGEKELFKGLHIYEKTDWAWQTSPVLYFNFATYGHKVRDLHSHLKNALKEQAEHFQISLPDKDIAEQFTFLIQQIAQQQGPVVILIDEYDKPIVDFITNISAAHNNREALKNFFAPLKDLELKGHIRFLFITGVSKFSRISVFSDLNNLRDLTLASQFADLLGITQKEMEHGFAPYIEKTRKKLQLSEAKLLHKIKLRYNGYSWDGETFMYNPFSLLNFFADATFQNYWFATGTPTFLVETIRDKQLPVKQLKERVVHQSFFDKFDLKNMDIFALLFQTGYLTIKSIDTKRERLIYTLNYPNEEVEESFISNLLEAYTYESPTAVQEVLVRIEDALFDYEPEVIIEQFKILFSSIAYQLLPKNKKSKPDTAENFAVWEGYFQTVIYLVISFLGIHIQCEVSRHKGRLDAVIHADDYLYLMEFKVDASAEAAVQQIKSREYAAAYKNSPKKIILMGIVFDKKTRNIRDWKVEEWKR